MLVYLLKAEQVMKKEASGMKINFEIVFIDADENYYHSQDVPPYVYAVLSRMRKETLEETKAA